MRAYYLQTYLSIYSPTFLMSPRDSLMAEPVSDHIHSPSALLYSCRCLDRQVDRQVRKPALSCPLLCYDRRIPIPFHLQLSSYVLNTEYLHKHQNDHKKSASLPTSALMMMQRQTKSSLPLFALIMIWVLHLSVVVFLLPLLMMMRMTIRKIDELMKGWLPYPPPPRTASAFVVERRKDPVLMSSLDAFLFLLPVDIYTYTYIPGRYIRQKKAYTYIHTLSTLEPTYLQLDLILLHQSTWIR